MISQWLQASRERDERRGYRIDKKRVAIAYIAEMTIVAASLWGAWLFAQMYGHNDSEQMEMMMLAPIGYAVIEFCRVPLAISARAHTSWVVRTVAVIGVICASGVTVKSMSQLGEIMFRPRLFDVVHAKEALQNAQATQASMAQQIKDADALVVSRRTALANDEKLATTYAQQLATLPKDQCSATGGTTRDGRVWKGQTCKTDNRIAPLQAILKQANGNRDADAQLVEQAVAQRKTLDSTGADHDVAAAQLAYREALLHSQLHSFTGMVFGVGPTEVTDAEVNQFLRVFVFLPSIFVAFASSFVAFTAVSHIKPSLIPFAPEGTDYLLDPLYQTVLADAVDQIEAKRKRAADKIGELT